MAARPLVSVQSLAAPSGDVKEVKKAEQLATPAVLLAPIRPDIVHFVHTNMAKNRRQPYAVAENAGHQHSAESWGTGRAVARVPRVSGGGTSRAGQGAFANMCRKGRMYAPTKIWRKWHRKINTNQKRFAVASALAASAVPALVMARGHRIDGVAEVPLVIDSGVESVQKTKAAVAILKQIGALADVEKAKDSRKVRRGVGKMRNRRHVQRRGPLVVFAEDKGITQAFRNLPGVELANVERLNLLQLAPGGHLGRFIIWTRSAFNRLNAIYGSTRRESQTKTGYLLPRNIMSNSDVTRLINSDEVQSKVRAPLKGIRRAIRKKNPLTNLGALVKLNPYALSIRRAEISAERRRAALKTAREKKGGAPETQTTKNIVAGDRASAAISRTHEPQQRENYRRLIQGDEYKRPVDAEGNVLSVVKILKPRASQPGDKLKPSTKPKVKKVRKVKVEEKVEKAAPVVSTGPLKKVKAPKEIRVKKAAKPKKEAAKKGAKGEAAKGEAAKGESAKGESGKKGGKDAPKEEAKKGGKKK
jgi:large subunit ribosomal protein L4e